MQARYPRRVKRRQLVTFSWANSVVSGSNSQNQTISAVDIERSIVRIVSPGCAYYGAGVHYAWWACSARLTSSTNVAGQASVIVNFSADTIFPISFTAEVIEYYEKPKSLQVIQGNGAASQTIATLSDPNTAEIGLQTIGAEGYPLLSAINAASVAWTAALGTYAYYHVIEW